MELIFNLLKAQTHKYIKRTGAKGKYRYFYRDPATGRLWAKNVRTGEPELVVSAKTKRIYKDPQTKEIRVGKTAAVAKTGATGAAYWRRNPKTGKQIYFFEEGRKPKKRVVLHPSSSQIATMDKAKLLTLHGDLSAAATHGDKEAKRKLVLVADKLGAKSITDSKKLPTIEAQKLPFNMATIRRADLQRLQKDDTLRNQFVMENQPFVTFAVKQALGGFIHEDAIQDANLGMLAAIKQFDPKRPTEAFLDYARKAMTRRVYREALLRALDAGKTISMETPIAVAEGETKALKETLADPRDYYAQKRASNLLQQLKRDIKNKQAQKLIDYMAQGYTRAEAARAMKKTNTYIYKLIVEKIRPAAEKYLTKSLNNPLLKIINDFLRSSK